MTLELQSIYRCPICRLPLEQKQKSYKCGNNHSYDQAKEGYVNLLPVHKKRTKAPGDSKAMLLARRQFLNAGYYSFLLDEIGALINTLLESEHSRILDLGCGEGYYGYQLNNKRCVELTSLSYFGCDISKPAVQMAAKQHKQSQFCVASAADLPYLDNAFDFVLNVFAPYNETEIVRVTKEQGHFLLVGPGAGHLKELAQFVYSEVQPHQGNPTKNIHKSGLEKVSETTCSTKVEVTGQHLEALLMMTPYYWSIKEENKARLLALKSLMITFEFKLELLQPVSANGEVK
ncbi:putative RNA methyltransferase [Planctobacterium marinum]|uniref:23S rRNA (Guanine(745)-N(1))-methyltransferase n=1 Tax=Planctobacterium marinum TaxID=1631968 RepID=A0AA48KRX6_9ALTE|nr:23S rRNA (guanine(745)-N(1))-methyltransferase [Planctobacterium marinum]